MLRRGVIRELVIVVKVKSKAKQILKLSAPTVTLVGKLPLFNAY